MVRKNLTNFERNMQEQLIEEAVTAIREEVEVMPNWVDVSKIDYTPSFG